MNTLKAKIEEAKAKLGLTQMELSEAIGKNPYYLDTVKHRGVSSARQNELIGELGLVVNGGAVMTERELMADLSNKLECCQRRSEDSQAANRELSEKLDFSEKQYMEMNDAYGRVCEKLAEVNRDLLIHKRYKHQYRNLLATVLTIGIIVILGFVTWRLV